MTKAQTTLIGFLIFTVSLLILISIVLEWTGFSNVFGNIQSDNLDIPQFEYIASNNNSNKDSQQFSNDWFDAARWLDTECPYYEDICS